MSEFVADPSVLTKEKLKSALKANNISLPNSEQRKSVYVELYLKHLTSQNNKSHVYELFSSDEELQVPVMSDQSYKKATRKTDRVRPEEMDVTELTNEGLKDQLLKYGVNAGPIVASTRKLYEKKLQKFLDQGPPEALVPVSEPEQSDNNQNGNTDSDQYSDKEEETTEPEPEPEPVPVVQRPLRSRGKTAVTTRTHSSQNKTLEEDEQEEVLSVHRKSRRSSRRLDQTVPASDDTDFSELSAAEMQLTLERRRAGRVAVPRDPKPLLADTPSSLTCLTEADLSPSPLTPDLYDLQDAVFTEKLYEKLPVKTPKCTPVSAAQQGRKPRAASSAPSEEPKINILDTAVLEVGSYTQESLSSRALKSGSVSTRSSGSAQPSGDLIHMMCRLSPSSGKASPSADLDSPSHPVHTQSLSVTEDCSGSELVFRGKQTKIRPFLSLNTPVRGQDNTCEDQRAGAQQIEKLSAVEQTPKHTERDLLREMFPNEVFNTPTGISATPRQPIRGASGRPFSDFRLDETRPRVSEFRQTSSSFTETRLAPRSPTVPLSPTVHLSSLSKPVTPPGVQARPVWLKLLLLCAVIGFLFFIYQAMETNQISPFSSSSAVDSSSL